MPKHEYYEELCALAAVGQLSEEEEGDLREHAESCEDCRVARREFCALLEQLPPLDDQIDLVGLKRAEEESYRKRFLVRARSEGRRFSDEAERGRAMSVAWRNFMSRVFRGVPQWALGAAAALLVVVGLARFGPQKKAQVSSSQVAKANVPVLAVQAANDASRKDDTTKLEEEIRLAEKRIDTLQSENASLQDRLHAVNQDLETARLGAREKDEALVSANQRKDALEEEVKQNQAVLASTRGELEKLRSEQSIVLASLSSERRTVDALSVELKNQSDSLDREKQLLTAGRDVTDLMGARSLHVVDVYDGDSVGKNRKSFGRIFYTEGKSLIFYAFDLDERKVMNAKYSYKAWGERQANPTSVKGLGILYVDDKAQRRWALKVDNPQQLSEIDSVFVTLEPPDGGDKPHGQKLLFAFLGSSANHP